MSDICLVRVTTTIAEGYLVMAIKYPRKAPSLSEFCKELRAVFDDAENRKIAGLPLPISYIDCYISAYGRITIPRLTYRCECLEDYPKNWTELLQRAFDHNTFGADIEMRYISDNVLLEIGNDSNTITPTSLFDETLFVKHSE